MHLALEINRNDIAGLLAKHQQRADAIHRTQAFGADRARSFSAPRDRPRAQDGAAWLVGIGHAADGTRGRRDVLFW